MTFNRFPEPIHMKDFEEVCPCSNTILRFLAQSHVSRVDESNRTKIVFSFRFFGILMFVYLFTDTKGAYSHFVYERSFGIPIRLFVPDALLSHIKITLNRRTLRFFFIWKPTGLHFLIHDFLKMFFLLIIFIIYYSSIILIIFFNVKQSLHIWFSAQMPFAF